MSGRRLWVGDRDGWLGGWLGLYLQTPTGGIRAPRFWAFLPRDFWISSDSKTRAPQKPLGRNSLFVALVNLP